MKFSDIAVPEVYKESDDFRFFLKWFELALSTIKYNTEHLIDLYDPQRCPADLLWMLADTMGYKFVEGSLPIAYNRLVLLYFMSMIKNKGSKNGVTLAAELNLAQFNIMDYGKENEILYDRLEDTSIPVNSVYVAPNPEAGYIDIVYKSEDSRKPIDVCIEYVRPVGMYCFQHSGVHVHSRTKISVDARLAAGGARDMQLAIGTTRVAHYTREDYASMQHSGLIYTPDGRVAKETNDTSHRRNPTWFHNSDAEISRNNTKAGYRTLYSLQLSNNEHIVKSLLPETSEIGGPIFGLGYGPVQMDIDFPNDYLTGNYADSNPKYNLRYNEAVEALVSDDVYTLDKSRQSNMYKLDATIGTGRPPVQYEVPAEKGTDPAPESYTMEASQITNSLNSKPAVNPIMSTLGDAISVKPDNSQYLKSEKIEVDM